MTPALDPLLDADPGDRLDVELYCRASTATARAVDRYASALERCREEGAVEAVDVTTWPTRIDLSTGDEELVAACDRFEDWADGTGVSLRPAFDRTEFESEFTGEHRRTLVTPVACLAAYEDGDLLAVYPHTDGDRTRTVEDGLDALRAVGRTATDRGGSTRAYGRSDD